MRNGDVWLWLDKITHSLTHQEGPPRHHRERENPFDVYHECLLTFALETHWLPVHWWPVHHPSPGPTHTHTPSLNSQAKWKRAHSVWAAYLWYGTNRTSPTRVTSLNQTVTALTFSCRPREECSHQTFRYIQVEFVPELLHQIKTSQSVS